MVVSIDIRDKQVSGLQSGIFSIDNNNLPVGVESVSGPVPMAGALSKNMLIITATSPIPVGDNQIVVKLFFETP